MPQFVTHININKFAWSLIANEKYNVVILVALKFNNFMQIFSKTNKAIKFFFSKDRALI